MTGLIVKGIGGFYYVKTDSGIIEAKGRGIFKKDGTTLAVGDMVQVEVLQDGKGIINSINPRKNSFIRPPIANVDMFVVVMAAAKPNPNFNVIDKFLIMAEIHGIEALICINKCDLVSDKELNEIKSIYDSIYPVVSLSCKSGEGIDRLSSLIKGKKAALSGPSGVGKSTILNLLHPAANMETGEISGKTSRGRHTTRHVEIFSVEGGGMIFDTPGFTSFDILEAEEDNLALFYPDFEKYMGRCRYDNCRHIKEPDCAVLDAVSKGEIHRQRYGSYMSNMDEIKNRKKY